MLGAARRERACSESRIVERRRVVVPDRPRPVPLAPTLYLQAPRASAVGKRQEIPPPHEINPDLMEKLSLSKEF
jgi:hypothetical protein